MNLSFFRHAIHLCNTWLSRPACCCPGLKMDGFEFCFKKVISKFSIGSQRRWAHSSSFKEILLNLRSNFNIVSERDSGHLCKSSPPKKNKHRTWNRSYSRKKRSDHFREDTHTMQMTSYNTTHTHSSWKHAILLFREKRKKQIPFFFSLFEVDVVCFVLLLLGGWNCLYQTECKEKTKLARGRRVLHSNDVHLWRLYS